MDATSGVPDEESPEVTQEMMDRGTVTFRGIVIRGPRKTGRPLGSGKKESIHVMFDKDIVAYYRASGPGWQTRMNAALRASMPKRIGSAKRLAVARTKRPLTAGKRTASR